MSSLLGAFDLLKSFIFVGYGNDWFFPIQILIFRMLRNNGDVRRCLYFELGLLVLVKPGLFLIFASCELAGGGEGLLRLKLNFGQRYTPPILHIIIQS